MNSLFNNIFYYMLIDLFNEMNSDNELDEKIWLVS